MISRNVWILVICLSIVGSAGIYSDFFLSLNAYNTNPGYFIEYEANQEVVNFFVDGDFPFILMLTIVIFPLGILFFLYKYEKHKELKYTKIYFVSIVLFVYFIFWTRLLAGLTWYLSTLEICSFFQGITTGFFIVLVYYVFIYFPKQTNSFLFKRSCISELDN